MLLKTFMRRIKRMIQSLIYGNLWNNMCEILRDKRGEARIPDNILRDIARALLPDVLEFFDSKEGQAKYSAYKANQEKIAEKTKEKGTDSA